MSAFPSKQVTGQEKSGMSGLWHLQQSHKLRSAGRPCPQPCILSNARLNVSLWLPVVLHDVQVGLQGGKEELQDFGVRQQLRRSSSDRNQPLEEIVIGQLASLWGLDTRLWLEDERQHAFGCRRWCTLNTSQRHSFQKWFRTCVILHNAAFNCLGFDFFCNTFANHHRE